MPLYNAQGGVLGGGPAPQPQASQPAKPKFNLAGGAMLPLNQNGQYANFTPEQQGVIQAYQNQAGSPYWDQWLQALQGGGLQGTGQYFFDQYSQAQAAQDAFSKQEQAEKEMIQAQYGGLLQNAQEGLAGRGMAHSGFAEQQLGQITGMEGLDLANLQQRMATERLQYDQQLRQMESMQQEAKRGRKRRKRMGIGGVVGGILGGVGGFFAGGPMGAMAGYQLGSGVGNYGDGGGQG